MATPSIWSSVAVSMQSALATALTVTAISKASPGVVTYTGTDPTNGDYILLLIQGMYQLNERVVRVANVNGGANTLELEGINTTNYDTFTSGTAEVITFGTTFSTLTNVNASGGEPKPVDVTTIHDNVDKIVYGNFSQLEYGFGSQWDPAETALTTLQTVSETKAQRAFKFAWSNNRKMVMYGRVAYSGAPTGQAQGLVESPVKVTSAGFPTSYST